MFSPVLLRKIDEDQKRLDLINENFRKIASEFGLTSDQIKALENSLDSKFRSINPKVQKMYAEYLSKVMAGKLKLFRGFVDSNRGITYDHINRTWTLTGTGTTEISWDGVISTISLPWTSPAHAATTNVIHYLYSADGVNYVTSTTLWDFGYIQVANAYYDANALYRFGMKETHGATQDPEDHRQNHQARGTYRVSGGTLTAGSYKKEPASPANADNRPLFDATTISDEDLQTTNAASLTESYTRYWASADGSRNWSLADANIVGIGATYPQYDNNGTMTDLANNRFMWIYRIEMPVSDDAQSQQFRTFLVPGSEFFTTKTTALGGAIRYRIGNLSAIAAEFVCVRRILIETSASYSTTGKFRIVTDELVEGSRTSSVIASVGGITGIITAGSIPVAAGPSSLANSRATDDGTNFRLPATDIESLLKVWDSFLADNPALVFSSQIDGIDPGIAAGPRDGSTAPDAAIVRDAIAQWTFYNNIRTIEDVESLRDLIAGRDIVSTGNANIGGQIVSEADDATAAKKWIFRAHPTVAFAALYNGANTPQAGNYVLAANATETNVNAPTALYLAIAGSVKQSISSTSVEFFVPLRTLNSRILRQTIMPSGTTGAWNIALGGGLGVNLTSSTGAVIITTSNPVLESKCYMDVYGHSSATRNLTLSQASMNFVMTGKTIGSTLLLDTIPINGRACYELYFPVANYCFVTRVALV